MITAVKTQPASLAARCDTLRWQSALPVFSCLSLSSFSYVDDAGGFHEDRDLPSILRLEYGCGLFDFKKNHVLAREDSLCLF